MSEWTKQTVWPGIEIESKPITYQESVNFGLDRKEREELIQKNINKLFDEVKP